MVAEGSRSTTEAIVARSQNVLDALPRAITIVDRDGVIVGWNTVSENLYGWTADEAVGQVLDDLITPTDLRATGMAIMQQVLAGERWSGRINAVGRDGSIIATESFLTPLRDNDGAIIGAIGAADDARDLRQLEQRTTDLAEHLVLALAAGELGTWRWDKASGITLWDDGMERLFGLEPGTFDGTYEAWVAMLHPEDRERSLGTLDRAVTENDAYTTEHRVMWPDGTVRWIQGRGKTLTDERGEVIGTIGCSSDVTDRKLAEVAALRRVQEAEAAAERERLQRERLEFLAAVTDVVRASTDHRSLMRGVARLAVPRLGDWCSVHYRPSPGAPFERVLAHVDPSKQEWAEAMRDRYPVDPDGVIGVPAVMRSGITQFVRRVNTAGLGAVIESVRPGEGGTILPVVEALHLTSLITVPLITKRGVIGAMQFISAESERVYDESDVALAEAAAGRVAEAVDNAWLIEQQRTIAVTLQAALLPDTLPTIPGASVAVRYWAAGEVAEVGGDFYDVFAIGERTWAIVIGDVCGTGPTAAAVTATARHTIRAAATHGASPNEVMYWVNDAIRAGGSGLFCTLLYATLEHRDDGSWLLTTVAGGHPLPILVERPGGGSPTATTMIGEHGTLIGILRRIAVHSITTVLSPGDTVVVHTDGVNDVRAPGALDDDALRAMVEHAADIDGPADAVAERLGTAIAEILPIPERDDDVALVVLRIS
ncbi:MAG: regulatory protein [Ilumatobacteraceae bacterium]|nr:regulatory protein [Ilumatobacteraceae bacterium]